MNFPVTPGTPQSVRTSAVLNPQSARAGGTPASTPKPGVLSFMRGLLKPAAALAPDPQQVAGITGKGKAPLPTGPVIKTTEERHTEQLGIVIGALATQAEARKLSARNRARRNSTGNTRSPSTRYDRGAR